MQIPLEMIAQFGIAGMSVYFMYKLASNAIESNTEAINGLKNKIEELLIFLKSKGVE